MVGLALPLAQGVLSALNHVLASQPALKDRMRAHAGRCIRIVVKGPLGDLRSDARIGPQGVLTATRDETPQVTLTLLAGVDALFAGLQGGPEALGHHMKVEGDVMLAGAVGEVARQIRWDFEEDMSRVVGDVMAHRIGKVVRDVAADLAGVRTRAADAVGRHLSADDGPAVGKAEFDRFAEALAQLAARVAQLERSAR